jgi:hypothetical protein
MKIKTNKLVFALTISCLSFAASTYAQQPVIPLYPGVAPGSENAKQKEVSFVNPDKQTRIRNVTQPTLTAYLPERGKANGTAIIVAPGGGFMHLAMEKEGSDMARWLQARGIAAFVLKYRLMDTGTEEEYRERAAAMTRATQPNSTAPATQPAPNPARPQAIEFAIADGAQAVKLVRQRAAEFGMTKRGLPVDGWVERFGEWLQIQGLLKTKE